MKISKELLKGSTATMILKVISEGETYGYEIVRKISERTEDVFQLNEGTLYPILHTMEKEKLVESFRKESDSGRERKYYRVTAAGQLCLVTRLEEWRLFVASVDGVLEGNKNG